MSEWIEYYWNVYGKFITGKPNGEHADTGLTLDATLHIIIQKMEINITDIYQGAI